MKNNNPILTVIIPVYNEEYRIIPTLETVSNYCRDRFPLSEVIIVNDGSVDNTVDVVKNYIKNNQNNKILWKLLLLKNNHGKGYAVRKGTLASSGDYMLLMDADGSVSIFQLDKLWKYRRDFDLIIGSRFLTVRRYRSQKMPRMIISKLGNILSKMLFSIRFTDTQCGFKLFNSKLAKNIFPKLIMNHFSYDIEILVRAKDNNYKIKEVPVTWKDIGASTVTMFRSSWMALIELLKFYRDYKR